MLHKYEAISSFRYVRTETLNATTSVFCSGLTDTTLTVPENILLVKFPSDASTSLVCSAQHKNQLSLKRYLSLAYKLIQNRLTGNRMFISLHESGVY